MNKQIITKAKKFRTRVVRALTPKGSDGMPLPSKRVSNIMAATGWDRLTTEYNLRKDTYFYDISRAEYEDNKFYSLDDEEKAALALKLNKVKMKDPVQKSSAIKASMEARGWTKEEAEKHLEEVCDKYQISYEDYRKYEFYTVEPRRLDRQYEIMIHKKSDKADHRAQVKRIMLIKGWTREELRETFFKTRARFGCNFKEYAALRLYDFTDEEMSKVYFYQYHFKVQDRYPKSDEMLAIYASKKKSNEYFSEYMRRPWSTTEDLTKERFMELFKDRTGVIYKPVYGHQGKGVKAFKFDEMTMEEAYEKVKALPSGVVEGLVIQHPGMAVLNPSSVNCMRIISVSSKLKPVLPDGTHADIGAVSVKAGGGGAVVDNTSSGGFVAGVDVDTGIICTDGVDDYGNRFITHPFTGTTFKGFQIPMFHEAKAFILDLIDKLSIEGVVGWDVAIAEDGPILIEANGRPEPDLQNLPYAPDHTGIKYRFDRYLY